MKTKTQANRLGMYADVQQILDAALASGGGTFELANHGMAINWRQRAYKFRKLYAEIQSSKNSYALSKYDRLTMPRIPDGSRTIIINVREVIGEFTPNRDPADVQYVPVPGDELFDVASDIAKKIKDGNL